MVHCLISKPSSVRIATKVDEAAIFWLLMNDLEADNGLGWVPSERKVFNLVHRCCTGQMGIAGVIDGPEGIVGSIGIEMISPWYSEDRMLMQMWQFVRPEFRAGTHHGKALEDFADWHRADLSERISQPLVLETCVMSHHRLKAKMRLWGQRATLKGGIFWVQPE